MPTIKTTHNSAMDEWKPFQKKSKIKIEKKQKTTTTQKNAI